jgi:hypothetical protein
MLFAIIDAHGFRAEVVDAPSWYAAREYARSNHPGFIDVKATEPTHEQVKSIDGPKTATELAFAHSQAMYEQGRKAGLREAMSHLAKGFPTSKATLALFDFVAEETTR